MNTCPACFAELSAVEGMNQLSLGQEAVCPFCHATVRCPDPKQEEDNGSSSEASPET